MEFSKKALIIISLFILSIIMACSLRDYSNPLLTEHFSGPQIFIQSPTNGDTLSGSVDIIGYASDISQVSRVEISTENGTYTILNPVQSNILSFNTNVVFYTTGNKDITIQAFDRFNIASTIHVTVYVDIVAPYLYIVEPNDYWTYTNAMSMVFAGTSTIAQGLVSTITIERLNDNTFFTVAGINSWSSTVALMANTTNNIKVTAVSDRGVENSQYISIVQDSIKPDVVFNTPLNNQYVPRDVVIEMQSVDTLSPILGTIYRMDNGNYRTNSGGPYTVDIFTALTNGPHVIYAQSRDMAGNDSPLRSIDINVDETIPAIWMYGIPYYTNSSTMKLYGMATVGTGYNLKDIAVSVNGGAFLTVDYFNNISDTTTWTNLTTLIANRDNAVTIRAISSVDRTNFYTKHFYPDTNPPLFNILTPLNGEKIVNKDFFDYMIDIYDNESGLYSLTYNVIVGGLTNMTNTIYFNGNQSYSEGGISESVKGGATVTNIISIVDQAFNLISRTNVVNIYPAIFVETNGLSNNGGFLHQPVGNIEYAVTKAQALGVSNVAILAGQYIPLTGLNSFVNGTGVNITGNNLTISGGWQRSTGAQTGISILDGNGSLKHVIRIQNADNIHLNNLIIREGNSPAPPENKGAGLYLENVNNSSFTSIAISNNILSGANAYGAGIYAINSDNNVLEAIIQKNIGAILGGGVYWEGDNNQLAMSNQANMASSLGGGLYLQGSGNKVAGTVMLNSATSKGGGIYLFNTINTLLDLSLIDNASFDGGGIYIDNGNGDNLMSSSIVFNNRATNGGGIYVDNGDVIVLDTLIMNNRATIGAGLYLNAVNNIQINSPFLYNVATDLGGALYAYSGDQVTINSSIISNQAFNAGGICIENGRNYYFSTVADIQYNRAGGAGTEGKGGGVSIIGGRDMIFDAHIHYNQANYGGGVFLISANTITVNSRINNNLAKNSGGGINIDFSTNISLYGTVENNIATNSGAGMFLSGLNIGVHSMLRANTSISTSSLGGGLYSKNLYNSSFHGDILFNTAANGGGCYITDSDMISIYSRINDNTAGYSGGGIYLERTSNLTVNSSIINNWSWGLGGGAIYVNTNSSFLTLRGSYSNNHSTNGSGGAVFLQNAFNVNVEADLLYNEAEISGGALGMNGSSNVLINTTILNNKAFFEGGALYINNSRDITIDNSIISNNISYSVSSVIHFGVGISTANIFIQNNRISGYNLGTGIAIYEQVFDLAGHTILNNTFYTNTLSDLYFDPGPGPNISIYDIALLNILTNDHDAIIVGGNIAR